MLAPAAGAEILGYYYTFSGVYVKDVGAEPAILGPDASQVKINYNVTMFLMDNRCDVDVIITNESYSIVRMFRLTDQSLGKHSVMWDGKDTYGNPVPDGAYKVNVTARYTGYKYDSQWGSTGSGDGQFKRPTGIAADRSGYIYVADTGNARLQKFDTSGYFISKWGGNGTGNGKFRHPFGIAAIGNSPGDTRVFVTDPVLGRVQKFGADGTYKAKWGNETIGSGVFEPWGIAADETEKVYVADMLGSCIRKFDASGGLLSTLGSPGSGNSQFHQPAGIASDGGARIYTVDIESNRVQEFYSGNSSFITKWGSKGTENGQFNSSVSAAVALDDRHVFIVDGGNNRVQEFNRDGDFIMTWGSKGTGNGRFDTPIGIAVDRDGNVYVTDSGNDRVQKFVPDVMTGYNTTTVRADKAGTFIASPPAGAPTAMEAGATAEPSGGGEPAPSSSAGEGPISSPAAGEPTISAPGASATVAPSGTAGPAASGGDTSLYIIGGLIAVVIVLVLAMGLMGGYIFGKKK